MFRYSEEEIKKGLQAEDDKIIRYIYKNYYRIIKSIVAKFNNPILDPQDVFHEGMVRMILNMRNNKFKQQSSIFSYLYGTCRNICLKELSRVGNFTPIANDFTDETETYDEYYEELNKVLNIFSMLDEVCQDIINLRFGINQKFSIQQSENKKNLKFDEIARILNIQTDNARQRFRRCLERLKGLIKHDSELDI